MAVSLDWPSTPGPLLLWAQVTFAWFLIQYLLATDRMNTAPDPAAELDSDVADAPAGGGAVHRGYRGILRYLDPDRHYRRQAGARVTALVLIAGILAGFSAAAAPLLVATAAFAVVLLLGRSRVGAGYGLIGWEIGINALFMATAGFLIGEVDLIISRPWIVLPIPEQRLACLFLSASALVYLGKGGTYIVRGFLTVAGTMPRFPREEKRPLKGKLELQHNALRGTWLLSAEQIGIDESGAGASAGPPDRLEFRRGRLIGNMERVVVALLAAVGSYPAIGFLVAAKGLVRSKEFEDRDYAEYFLVGTLASTTLALAVGTALRLMIHETWY